MTLAGRPNPSICIFRLSALGDVCHTVPLMRAIQDQLPEAGISWIIDRSSAPLLRGLDEIELIVLDKRAGLSDAGALRRRLRGRRFDALLLTQRSLRANVLSLLIRAKQRIGYDRGRARELHRLVIGDRIPEGSADQHVMDCILSFLEPLGLDIPARPRWDFPLSDEDRSFAREHIADGEDWLIVSPGSSFAERVWRPEHYAAIADHAIRRHGLRVLLCGGAAPAESRLGEAITKAMRERPANLIGRDTLQRFLALCARARVVLTPDSGPAHLANAMGAPVLGLYAATDCRRSGPYFSRELCVNAFPAAARRFVGAEPDDLRWGKHIHVRGVMDLITPEAVRQKLDDFLARGPASASTHS